MPLITFEKNKHFLFLILAVAASWFCIGYANATTYYVATNGNDSNPGTNTQPVRTIKKGVSLLSAGDTLFVKSGTYFETILSSQMTIPNGTSWSNPITVSANPGHTVTIKPPANRAFFWILDGQSKFLIIKDFIVDGANSALHGFKLEGGTKYVRISNCEIKNSKSSGVLVTNNNSSSSSFINTYHELKNLNVHHNGSSAFGGHGFYIETSHNLVESSNFYNNFNNGGKFFHGNLAGVANNNVARNNKFFNNSTSGNWSCGLLLGSGNNSIAYNNIAYGNINGFCTYSKTTNVNLYNNISYENDIYGIYVGLSSNTGSRISNNTAYNNGTYGIFVGDGATNATVRNNISHANNINLGLTGASSSNNLTTNPSFVNPTNKDFHLQSGSSAIDGGITISGINSDHDGIGRPKGSAFDIGAYEFQSGSTGTGGGGGSGGTFPPSISSPTPGSTLSSSTVTFSGNHTSQDLEHWLYVGTSAGANNLHNSGSMGSAHSRTVSGLPSSGTIYVRYWTRNSSGWSSRDHSYTMNTGSGGGSAFPPPISSPTPGSTLSSSTVTFSGNHTSQDLEHWLYVGTSAGANNLHNSGSMGSAHSRTVSGLPSSGTIYVRYWTRNSSGWSSRDHSYTMNTGSGGGSAFPPTIGVPTPGSTLSSSTVTFSGNHTSQDLEHWLYVGTSAGANNLHNSGSMGSAHSRTVSGLPSSGTIYVRYWTRNSSGWSFRDHTYSR